MIADPPTARIRIVYQEGRRYEVFHREPPAADHECGSLNHLATCAWCHRERVLCRMTKLEIRLADAGMWTCGGCEGDQAW